MTPDPEHSWLVLRAQAGDRAAWQPLLAALAGALRPYLVRLMGGASAGEDVLQDVLTIVYRKLGGLSDPALLRPWAFRIASRAAFRRLKADRRERQAMAAFAAEPVLDPGSATDETVTDALLALLPRLSPASRAVLALRYEHGLSLEAVAAALELPLGTVKSRLAYGLAALRRLTAQSSEPESRP
jgi:RNA polymerase sigma-70 factor (ECF subfamily)